MDLVETVGYIGQELHFLDESTFAFQVGNGIALYDTAKGIKEIMWKFAIDDKGEEVLGIKAFCVNWEKKLFAVAKKGGVLEVYNLIFSEGSTTVSSRVFTMTTESLGGNATIDIESLSFSWNGDRIYALTGVMKSYLLIWELSDGVGSETELVVSHKLSQTFTKVIPNPVQPDFFALHSKSRGVVQVGYINEILRTFSIKMLPVEPELDAVAKKKVNFALWLPGTSLLLGCDSGHMIQVNCSKALSELDVRLLGCYKYMGAAVVPVKAALTVSHLILATADCTTYWFSLDTGNLGNSPTTNATSATLNIDIAAPVTQVCQLAEGDGARPRLSSLALDKGFSKVLMGTTDGRILMVDVEVVEQPQVEDEDHKSGDDTEVAKSIISPVLVANEAARGVTLCSQPLLMNVKKVGV